MKKDTRICPFDVENTYTNIPKIDTRNIFINILKISSGINKNVQNEIVHILKTATEPNYF
jgi:hypothetical protein